MNRSPRRRRTKWLIRIFAGVVGLLIVLFLAGLGYLLSLPEVGDAQARTDAAVSVHDGIRGRLPLPRKLADAVVATEIEHFYSNVVVNVFDGGARAGLAALHTSSDPGGSTIAQQLAKALYGDGGGIGATMEEIALGVKLSVSYSKAEILNMYLNAVYYGDGYWGDIAAARGYFGVVPDKLDWAEASMLAGLPQAPSAYDPVTHLALAKARQRHVLDQQCANHYLTSAQADAAFREPLPVRRG